ncbi:O-methyltransferase [Pseudonocardia spinosispora]|uniref:O-methyltransferase n=1 Tax=Pseudonocardia spinosispora TaxID=103441 RepID=UPI00041EDE0F|nr:class I SAM-dependent methyltransferase [Pseudonocardia spinosispora]
MARRLINHILAGTSHILRDPRIELVLERIYSDAQRAADDARAAPSGLPRAADELGDFGYSLRPGQGEFLYLMCRSIGARRVVDFSTSAGATAIYCAAALRDNGAGTVISSDHRKDRRSAARHNLTEAGLIDYVDLRLGNPLDTLRSLPGPVDLAYLDGWPELGAPSLALSVLELIRPGLRPGALVLNDSHEPDYLDHVRDPTSGFRTSVLDFGVLSVVA